MLFNLLFGANYFIFHVKKNPETSPQEHMEVVLLIIIDNWPSEVQHFQRDDIQEHQCTWIESARYKTICFGENLTPSKIHICHLSSSMQK